MSEKHVVYTEHAPEPIGPYSQAIRVGNLVFVSGQGSMDRAAGHMVRDSVEAETRQVLTNLKTILEAAGSSAAETIAVMPAMQTINPNTFVSNCARTSSSVCSSKGASDAIAAPFTRA